LIFDLLDDDDDDEIDFLILISSIIHSWPFKLKAPRLYANSLLIRGVEYFFEKADSLSLKKITYLDYPMFELIYSIFSQFWVQSKEPNQKTLSHLKKWKMFKQVCLDIVFHWLAFGLHIASVFLFVSLPMETVHRYLRFGIANLFKTLKIMPKTTFDPPSRHYLCDIEEQITRFYRSIMKGCCAVVNGSLH
jgi:hypothetical protein